MMSSLRSAARPAKWQRYRLPRWVIPVVLVVVLVAAIAIVTAYFRAQHEPPADAATALEQLESLAPEPSEWTPDYDRDLFGQRWADVDRNGCDTRNDVLARDLIDVTFKAKTNNCKVRSGTLTDPYDGSIVHFVSGQNTSVLVQIDHVVPLAWAWHHGAYAWTDAERLEFANDPTNLRATSEAMNQSKKASGPGSWLPPDKTLQCRYAIEWVTVLSEYDLSINTSDRDATRRVLNSCPA